jgi:N-acetylneuraminate synthase
MLIEKEILGLVVSRNDSILEALTKINENKKRIVFVLSEAGHLEGSFSDGDFRRYITSNSNVDIHASVAEAMNRSTISASILDNRLHIENLLKGSPGIDSIPLVDSMKRVVAVATATEFGVDIGGRLISETAPAFIIAEIGNNHNGSLKLAKQLVDVAVDAGVDCVKFQMRNMEALYKSGASRDESADLGVQYTVDLLSKFQLSNDELLEVFDYSRSQGIIPLCTPWDAESIMILEEYGMPAYKIASADLTNHALLEQAAATGKTLICSTGMSVEREISSAVSLLRSKGAEFVFLHCNSTYPTPFKDINLSYLERLKDLSLGQVVGYSGHERGIEVPIAAVAMGAKVIEKHLTLDRSMEGADHKVSLLPSELRDMVRMIRNVETSFGKSQNREISQGEMINRESLAKSLVCCRNVSKGEVIRREDVEIKSPGQGLQPCYLDDLVGRVANRDVRIGDFFYESDLRPQAIEPRPYEFDRPFGIPVRYHDFEQLANRSNLDFVEFHLSYQDMDLNPSDYVQSVGTLGFTVHAPELFEADHLLDLSTNDKSYRDLSVSYMNRVCDVARGLQSTFSTDKRAKIVVNAGGFSTSGFLPESQKSSMYEQVAESLSEIDSSDCELLIQTMPPFPWHFGGQSYHNLFVNPREIVEFCEKHQQRVCLDVSHSMMACNFYGWDLIEFVSEIGDYIGYLHIVDALGVDGEGVQIGEGDVDFHALGRMLSEKAADAPFIPEVWQGHKNEGEGFWLALEFLESYF